MLHPCPVCSLKKDFVFDSRTIHRFGSFRRKSDGQTLQRFRCRTCRKTYSAATFHPCYRQKKRQKNRSLFELLSSGNSLRRSARLLRLSRKTVARKLIFLGSQSRDTLHIGNALSPKAQILEFDDLETFEHTKCKPLSVTLAVEHKTRRILGFQVARMNAKGLLAEKARKKYGLRKDERTQKRRELFQEIGFYIEKGALIKSDSNPHYVQDVIEFFPGSEHQRFLGKRGAVTGQGELKKVKFDPLFSLNHTCAMLRANISRLIRKTWCTTKDARRLNDHLAIYALYHNQHLKGFDGVFSTG